MNGRGGRGWGNHSKGEKNEVCMYVCVALASAARSI